MVSAQASFVTKVIMNPVTVVKTRVMTIKTHRNFILDFGEAVRKIYKV